MGPLSDVPDLPTGRRSATQSPQMSPDNSPPLSPRSGKKKISIRFNPFVASATASPASPSTPVSESRHHSRSSISIDFSSDDEEQPITLKRASVAVLRNPLPVSSITKRMSEIAISVKKRLSTSTSLHSALLTIIDLQNGIRNNNLTPEIIEKYKKVCVRSDVQEYKSILEETARMLGSLAFILNCPMTKEWFHNHVRMELSDENYDFYHAVNELDKLPEGRKLSKFKEIVETFIDVNAEKQGNFSGPISIKIQRIGPKIIRLEQLKALEQREANHEDIGFVRQEIQKLEEEIEKEIVKSGIPAMKEAQTEIFNLMDKDTFLRFKKSDLYQKMKDSIGL